MRIYYMTITGDKYPTDYAVKANTWADAIKEGIKQWEDRFNTKRTMKMSITIEKSNASSK